MANEVKISDPITLTILGVIYILWRIASKYIIETGDDSFISVVIAIINVIILYIFPLAILYYLAVFVTSFFDSLNPRRRMKF